MLAKPSVIKPAELLGVEASNKAMAKDGTKKAAQRPADFKPLNIMPKRTTDVLIPKTAEAAPKYLLSSGTTDNHINPENNNKLR